MLCSCRRVLIAFVFLTSTFLSLEAQAQTCGDGVLNPKTEACESNNLNGKTCVDFGYEKGTLSCNSSCTNFNFVGCVNKKVSKNLCQYATQSDSKSCTSDICSVSTGAVTHKSNNCPAGQECNTQGNCAPLDKCKGVKIDDGNKCTKDSCDSKTGLVSHTPMTCAAGATCKPTTGVCAYANPCDDPLVKAKIDDKNSCTVDACNSRSGAVTHTPLTCAAGQSCNASSGKCELLDPCKAPELMSQLDDGDKCTKDICDSNTKKITHEPIKCSENSLCNSESGECNQVQIYCSDSDPSADAASIASSPKGKVEVKSNYNPYTKKFVPFQVVNSKEDYCLDSTAVYEMRCRQYSGIPASISYWNPLEAAFACNTGDKCMDGACKSVSCGNGKLDSGEDCDYGINSPATEELKYISCRYLDSKYNIGASVCDPTTCKADKAICDQQASAPAYHGKYCASHADCNNDSVSVAQACGPDNLCTQVNTYVPTSRKKEMDIKFYGTGNEVCALDKNSDLHCGPLTYQDTAVADLPVVLKDVLHFDTSSTHACAVDKKGKLYCWGDNTKKQTCPGDIFCSYKEKIDAPYLIMHGVLEVAVGKNFTCLIQTDEKLYCYGNNTEGATMSPLWKDKIPASQMKLWDEVPSKSNYYGLDASETGLCVMNRWHENGPAPNSTCWNFNDEKQPWEIENVSNVGNLSQTFLVPLSTYAADDFFCTQAVSRPHWQSKILDSFKSLKSYLPFYDIPGTELDHAGNYICRGNNDHKQFFALEENDPTKFFVKDIWYNVAYPGSGYTVAPKTHIWDYSRLGLQISDNTICASANSSTSEWQCYGNDKWSPLRIDQYFNGGEYDPWYNQLFTVSPGSYNRPKLKNVTVSSDNACAYYEGRIHCWGEIADTLEDHPPFPTDAYSGYYWYPVVSKLPVVADPYGSSAPSTPSVPSADPYAAPSTPSSDSEPEEAAPDEAPSEEEIPDEGEEAPQE